MAFGSLLIKERLRLSDEETVAQITENPYLQYFVGLKEFQKNAPLDPSQLVYFRKRFSSEAVDRINEAIAVARVRAKLKGTNDSCSTDDTTSNDAGSGQKDNQEQPEEKIKNQGKLLVDATCTPADVAYPTDLNLLNKAREKAEQIIDTLHLAVRKGLPSHEPIGRRPANNTWQWPAANGLVARKCAKLSDNNCGSSVGTWDISTP